MRTGSALSPFHSPEAGNKTLFDFRVAVLLANLGKYNQRIIAAELFEIVGKRRPYKPFYTVAFYRLAVLFGKGNTHNRPFLCRSIDYGKRTGKYPFTLFEQLLKIRVFFEPLILHLLITYALLLPSSLTIQQLKDLPAVAHRLRLCTELLSALISSSLQHLSSGGGSHSLSESVYLTSLSLFRLVSSFHSNLLLYCKTLLLAGFFIFI